MLTLYKFGRIWGVPDASPFCMKLETWLRMAGLPFETRSGIQHMKLAPKKKMPFIELDGQRIGDSELIIAHLKQRFGDPLDAPLGETQKAVALLVQRTLDEHCYFAMVHSRWLDPANWPLVRETFFRSVPSLIRGPVARFMQKKVARMLYGQGAGRHSPAELYAMAIADLKAVLTLLGDQPFFFGESPSSVDAVLHSYFANLSVDGMRSPMKDFLSAEPRVAAYVARMNERYYPERRS